MSKMPTSFPTWEDRNNYTAALSAARLLRDGAAREFAIAQAADAWCAVPRGVGFWLDQLPPAMLKRQRARFFVFINGGECIKVTLDRGQTATHREAYDNGEGWTVTRRAWHFDGDEVTLEWHVDATDCDGRHQRWGKSTCELGKLQAGYEPPHHVGVRFPIWKGGQEHQRDHTAEAMNY